MELYTLKVNPVNSQTPGTVDIQNVIDKFESLIWTERYYGDSECEIVLPIEMDLIEKLPLDIFLGIEESNELLMLDTINIEDNRLKLKGISVLSWLNNRFIRTTNKNKVRSWTLDDIPPGQALWEMLFSMVSPDSVYMTTDSIGIPQKFINKLLIPEIGLYDFYSEDDPITISVSFAPLYDEMRNLAFSYQIGMRIIWVTKLNPDAEKPLGFQSYKGLNKTHNQDPDKPQNPIIRFSRELDSLENIRELRSKSIYKTIAFSYAPNIDIELGDIDGAQPGIAYVTNANADDDPNTLSGFDCRALQVFAENLTGFSTPSDFELEQLAKGLGGIARDELAKAMLIEVVDGDIVQNNVYQYGRDYSLGDIVELQGNDGVISAIRVTEHIIAEEGSGEKAYVTYGNEAQDITP